MPIDPARPGPSSRSERRCSTCVALLTLAATSQILLGQNNATAGGVTVTSVSNAASNLMAELPSYGIAQGSMFVIKGSGIGPATLALATTFPLGTTLEGTSVAVSAGGVSYSAIVYYTSATQVAAILPSATAIGEGTLTVTYNGQTSASFPVTVVKSALGVFTLNQSGAGDAIATLGAGFVGPLNAANPGEVVAFWATGLGPVNFDETGPAEQFDMTDITVEAWVGGKSAEVVFRGRNGCCSSVDTLYVRIPPGTAGCMTPVVFKTGAYISNTTTISTAASGRICEPTLSGLSIAGVQSALSKPLVSTGGVTLYRSGPVVGQIDTLVDTGVGGVPPFSLFRARWGSLHGTFRSPARASSSRD